MNHKRKSLYLLLWALLLMAVFLIIGIASWFFSPGAHVLLNRLRVEFEKDCFIVNPDTGEIVDETHITFHTSTNLSAHETTGFALVEGYPISGKLLSGCEDMSFGNATLVHYSGVEMWSDTSGSAASDFSDITYLVYFGATPEDAVVLISSYTPETGTLCAVYADTPEEAVEKCRVFWSNLANK